MAITQREASAKYKERVLIERALLGDPSHLSKKCSVCKIEKSLVDFHKCTNGPLGRSSRCKSCKAVAAKARYYADADAARAKQRTASEKHRANKTVYRQKYYTLTRFGKTPEEVSYFVQAYLDANGPKCFCCGIECEVVGGVKKAGLRRLVLDHNHDTGELRSMICDFCNTALGKLGDKSIGVQKLLTYIKRYEDGNS